jgi:hypothetical protein
MAVGNSTVGVGTEYDPSPVVLLDSVTATEAFPRRVNQIARIRTGIMQHTICVQLVTGNCPI